MADNKPKVKPITKKKPYNCKVCGKPCENQYCKRDCWLEDKAPDIIERAGLNNGEYGHMVIEKFRWVDVAMHQKVGNWLASVYTLPVDQRKGLYIYGAVGTGKTHLMLAVVKEIIKHTGWQVKLTTVASIFFDMYGRLNNYDKMVTPLKDIPILLLDDLGSEHLSDWSTAVICDLLDTRLVNQRLTFVTSNLNPEQIRDKLDPRIISRLYGMCAVMQLTGKDGRY